MPRTVPEWIGKTDDTPPPKSCKRRILARQGDVCALTGLPFDEKNKPRFDHKVPLWLGGENRESNLQALRDEEAHKPKTKAEAKVRSKVHAVIDKRFGLETKKTAWPKRPFSATQKPASKRAAKPDHTQRRSLFCPVGAVMQPSRNPEIGDAE